MSDDVKKSWLGRLRAGLGKSSEKLTGSIGALFRGRKLDQAALDELEEALIMADIGVTTAAKLASAIAKTKFDKEVTEDEIKRALADEMITILDTVAAPLTINPTNKPHVVLVCGVNGSGKTTTIGKLANQFKSEGKSVMLVAGDTFRAAAVEQLQIWGERSGCEVISGKHGGDAAGLVYDAYEEAKTAGIDVMMVDTAGRLQNRKDLMAELEKIIRVIKKIDDSAPHTTLLVMDSTIGQNAHSQVETFKEMVNISGLVMTKLDGSARGGVVIGLAEKFGLPVHAVGVGEGIDDLKPFESKAFAHSLMGLPVD